MNYGSLDAGDEYDEKLYKLEYGVTCQNDPCFIQPEELMLLKSATWNCKHGQLHDVMYLWYWDNAKHRDQRHRFQQVNYRSEINLNARPPFDLLEKVAFAVGIEGGQLGFKLGLENVVERMLREKGCNMFRKTLRILDFWMFMAPEKATVENLIKAMLQIGGRGIEIVYKYYRKNDRLEGTSDENLLKICGTSTKIGVKRQWSNSLSVMYVADCDIQHVEKDWFYKLNILVDDCNLHLINDRRLETKYMKLHNELRKRGNYLFSMSLSGEIVCSEFELIYQQMTGLRAMTICDCVKENLDLMCRFLLAKGVAPMTLKEAVMMAMNQQLPKIAKAVAWCFTRKFVQDFVHKNVLRCINDIWPGFHCLCNKNEGKGHSKICSEELVIIVEVLQQIDGIPGDFFGVPVKQICTSFDQTVAEHTQVQDDKMDTNEDGSNTPIIEGEVAEIYFKKHTKLTMIYILPGTPTLSQFCCQIKQTIPIGEDHFPQTVLEFDTNVREGHVRFLTKIKIGDEIIGLLSAGTLGGFVQMHGFNAFLTCAHVIYNRKRIVTGNKREMHRAKTKVFCNDMENGLTIECGYVLNWAFEHDNEKETSVDAAVVVLDENITTIDEKDIVRDRSENPKSVDFLGMKGPYLNDNYITHKTGPGVMKARSVGITSGFYEGNITFEDYDADEEKFKDKEHGMALCFKDLSTQIKEIEEKRQRPANITREVHFQQYVIPELEDSLKNDRQCFRFYHQLLLEDFSFKPGDSGTCIYVTEDRTTQRPDCQPNRTGCLAMAIASFHDKNDRKEKCIATPMKAILKTLGLI